MLLRIRVPSQASQVALFATSATEQVCTASLENTTVSLNNRFSSLREPVDESSYVVFSNPGSPKIRTDWSSGLICWRRRTA